MWQDRESKITSLTLAVLVLSLECVLEGLVTQSELRLWVFHAVAVGSAAWALRTREQSARQLTMVAGIVAVLNEALFLAQESESLKYLIPSGVLLTASIVGLIEAMSPQRSDQSVTGRPSNFQLGGTSTVRTPPQLPNTTNWVPGQTTRVPTSRSSSVSTGEFLTIVGAIASWYSLYLAEWYDLDKWFGLRSVSVGFSQLREASGDLDGLHAISSAYLSGGYLLTYLLIFVVLGSSVLMRTRWSMERFAPNILSMVLAPLALAWQAFLVIELSDDASGSLLGAGPWIGVGGLCIVTVGSIAQRMNK